MNSKELLLKNRRVLIPVCVIALLVIGFSLLIHQLRKPVSASNISTAGNTSIPMPPQPILVDGTYAKFSYPGGMQPMTGMEGPMGEEVAVYNYKMPDTVPWHLAITINHLHEPGLSYDTNFLVRKNHPDQYQQSTLTANGNTFTVMTDTQAGGFAKVAFVLHGDLSADISLTGDDSSGDTTLAQAFQQVLTAWRWNQ